MLRVFLFLLFFSSQALGQYFPRGMSYNDNYLPNLDEPDKWMISVDGIYDWQKEKNDTSQTSYQTTRAGFNLFYGGKNFRGGAQVLHDFNRDVKDLSIGMAMAFNRPLFVEGGLGYLTRSTDFTSSEGWSFNIKVGYYWNWIMQINYRVRVRVSLMYNYKKINEVGDPAVTTFHPFIGFEFET